MSSFLRFSAGMVLLSVAKVLPIAPLPAQVTSVSQLSDVRPTDWAFTTLQSLVERYGCIAGYPDRTFRGQRTLSRFEFAADLNACLDKMNEIIAAGLADKVSTEDLVALQRLQEEFAAELATLRGRVDALETRTSRLEAQQFSTATKLEGEVIMAITGAGSGTEQLFSPSDGALATSGNPGRANATVVSRVRLSFNTTFTGGDLLQTRLQVGNDGGSIGDFLDNGSGFRGFTGFGNSSRLDYGAVGNGAVVDRLRYDFSPTPDLRVSLGPIMGLNDHLDTNSFANAESEDFSIGMMINNPLILPVNEGAGAFVVWNPGGGAFTLRLGYVAAEAAFPTGDGTINRGLFGDAYQGIVELEFSPVTNGEERPFAVKLQYTRAAVDNLDYNTGGVNFEWALGKNLALFGRYGFGSLDSRGAAIALALPSFVNGSFAGTSLNPQTWSAGLAFPDLFQGGDLGAIALGQPFVEGAVGNATQTNLEVFYRLPLTENITLTPDLQVIFNPNNNSGNNTIVVGTLRTVFSF